MSDKEQRYEEVCKDLNKGTTTITRAATILRLSTRQVKRILARYDIGGVQALVHKSRGRKGRAQFDEENKKKILKKYKKELRGHSIAHAVDIFKDEDKLSVSEVTLKKWLVASNLYGKCTKPPEPYYMNRTRKLEFGKMLQGDGSFHHLMRTLLKRKEELNE